MSTTHEVVSPASMSGHELGSHAGTGGEVGFDRLAGASDVYGLLPARHDLDALIERAMPMET